MKLGEITKKYREEKSFTLDYVAQKTGLSKGFLSRLEKGDFDSKNVSLDTLIKLSKGYDVKVKEILDLLNVIEQDSPVPLEVYLRSKYGINDNSDVRVIDGLIKRLKKI